MNNRTEILILYGNVLLKPSTEMSTSFSICEMGGYIYMIHLFNELIVCIIIAENT